MKHKLPWTQAGLNGLLLSLITIAVEVPIMVFKNMPGIVSTILTMIKIAGSFTLLLYFVRKYTETLEYVSFGDGFKYGFAISFFSSIVCTLAHIVTVTMIVPDLIPQTLDSAFQIWESAGMAGMFDYNTLLKMMPGLLAGSKMFSCLIFGLLFSSIIASMTKTRLSPFANYGTSDGTDNSSDNSTDNSSDDNTDDNSFNN